MEDTTVPFQNVVSCLEANDHEHAFYPVQKGLYNLATLKDNLLWIFG